MIEQISLLTVDLIGHISCLLLCTALFRRTCAKRQLVLAFLGTLAAGYLITVVPVIREFPIKAILLVINDLAEFPLSNKETVVVLSNLLDNAIEACKTQKGTRLIRVKIQCSEEKTILSVMNTIDKAPVMENGLPVTTKADPLAHGYGLQNIVSILADHGACPAILCQDGWFQFSTVLFHQTISPAPEHD